MSRYAFLCWLSITAYRLESFQLKNVDFDKSEHRSPEFFQMNPLHQVPTLDDDGFYITDSHAIITYLAANTALTSPDQRILARINQLLYFDFELFRVMGEVGVSFSKFQNSDHFHASFCVFRSRYTLTKFTSHRKRRWQFCTRNLMLWNIISSSASGFRASSWLSLISLFLPRFQQFTWVPLRCRRSVLNSNLFSNSIAPLTCQSTLQLWSGSQGAKKPSSATLTSSKTRRTPWETSWNRKGSSWSLKFEKFL